MWVSHRVHNNIFGQVNKNVRILLHDGSGAQLRHQRMAQLQLQPPEPFNFRNPDDWPQWRRRFEQFCVAYIPPTPTSCTCLLLTTPTSLTHTFHPLSTIVIHTFNFVHAHTQVRSMDYKCGEWVECMGVASGCG